MANRSILAPVAVAVLLLSAGRAATAASPVAAHGPRSASVPPPVHVVLFTHIEDNTPAGTIGTPTNRMIYLNLRTRLLEVATLARLYDARWSFEPDWKILLAAQQYERSIDGPSTANVNFLVYLRNSLGVAIDPHSHENGGYNYTDIAHLLETLGVGGSTVIGGHIWDPAYPQFQEWDRFRVPVPGLRYPTALWRGDILMGSGTPNHVNDPIVSGVWRPRDRYDYWTDDPAGNIAAIGAFRGDVAGISELSDLYESGQVDPACMLTASVHIKPADISAPGGLAAIEASVLQPLAALRDQGRVVLTDFTSLIGIWREKFGARACTYDPASRP